MLWQDMVITASQIFFLLALIPTIKSPDEKPPLTTAATTAFFMSTLVPTVFTLELYLSASVTALLAAGWWTIAWQVWRKRHHNKSHPTQT